MSSISTLEQIFQDVLELEAQQILLAKARLQAPAIRQMAEIFQCLMAAGGSLVFCGIGKSGIIGQKLASTFTSLGLSSFFLHPVEALHGDLGRLTKNDAIVFISKSGTTEEILKLLPYVRLPRSMMVGLLGGLPSPIADKCAVVFDCTVSKEACLNNQAPTCSTTLALSLGDAMAVLYEHIAGISKENFAENHPGGLLGKTLRLRVQDLMIPLQQCPLLQEEETLKEVLLKMTERPLGICAIISTEHKLKGIIVEGDIRRTLNESQAGLQTTVGEMMNRHPVTVAPEELAYHALVVMEKRQTQISVLPVVQGGRFLGILRLHDLLREGFLPQDHLYVDGDLILAPEVSQEPSSPVGQSVGQ